MDTDEDDTTGTFASTIEYLEASLLTFAVYLYSLHKSEFSTLCGIKQ